MVRCALYRRVSEATATNVTGSMHDQLAACRAYAEHPDRQWDIVADYAEIGKSAYRERSLKKREQYQQMLLDAKAHRFDVVVVFKYDRFSRRMRTALQAQAELEQAGVKVRSATEQFDESTGAGRFAVRQMLNIAELFSDMHGERIKARRKGEAQSGRHVGPIPVGYRAGERAGDLIPQPPYDALVVQALTLYAPGQLSPGTIAQSLNSQGYTMPSGRALIAQDVRRIASNAPLYAGRVLCDGIWIPGTQHPPLIDADLCGRVLATFERRSVAQDRRFVRTQEPTALLAGLMYCEVCRQAGRESKAHYMIDKRKSPPYRRYRCKVHSDGGDCDAPYILAAPVEAQLLTFCDVLALPQDWIDEALGIAEQQLSAQPTPTIDPAKVQEKIRRLGQRYNDLLIDDAQYKQELSALRAQLSTAAAQPRPRPSLLDIAEHLRDVPGLIQHGAVGEQRAIIGELFDQVYAMRDIITAIRPTSLYAPLLLAAHESVRGTGYLSGIRDTLTILPARSEVPR